MLVWLEDPSRPNASCISADQSSCLWRKAKVQEFEDRLAKLAVKDLHAVKLLHKLRAETIAMDELQEAQSQQVVAHHIFFVQSCLVSCELRLCLIMQGRRLPWWADGEYDDAKADRSVNAD